LWTRTFVKSKLVVFLERALHLSHAIFHQNKFRAPRNGISSELDLIRFGAVVERAPEINITILGIELGFRLQLGLVLGLRRFGLTGLEIRIFVVVGVTGLQI